MPIYVFCPDYAPPSGGIRKLYRHVDVLNRHGFPAAIVHEQPGFRCRWFANDTTVLDRPAVKLSADDVLVLPEIYGPMLAEIAPGVRKVVFNQNAYLTFAGYGLDPADLRTSYRHRDVVAALVVSEDNREYLSYAFPQLPVHRIRYGLDTRLFACGVAKRQWIGYMPRKNAAEVVQVVNLLKQRGALEGFELVPIDGQPEREVARLLGKCLLFLSFGHPEGFGLPPLEAMACGCVVVGYHGRGGREFFRPAYCDPVEAGDVVGFARSAERALQTCRSDPAGFAAMGQTGAAMVRREYTLEAEEASIVAAWSELAGCPIGSKV